jgi:hypothetical protein
MKGFNICQMVKYKFIISISSIWYNISVSPIIYRINISDMVYNINLSFRIPKTHGEPSIVGFDNIINMV